MNCVYVAAIQVRSLYPRTLNMWYDDGSEGTFHGRLRLGQETTVNSYHGHTFYFTELGDDKTRVASITASNDQVLYIITSNKPEDEGVVPQHLIEDSRKQQEFMEDYYQRTGTELVNHPLD